MKKFIPILFLFALASCGGSAPNLTPIKGDTVEVIYRSQLGGPLIQSTATWTTTKSRRFKDSLSTNAEWTMDTLWQVKVPMDTVRDSNKKPLLDSLKRIQYRFEWEPIPSRFVQRITVATK